MKRFFLIITILWSFLASANMASPYIGGTESSSAFINKHVDVLKESILVTINSNFSEAKFNITYSILVDSNGVNIPLLFYAVNYSDGFIVKVDGIEVSLLDVPQIYDSVDSTFLDDFDKLFKPTSWSDVPSYELAKGNGAGQYITIEELKYFKLNLTPGNHTIHVEYSCLPWVDRSDWIRDYSFRYSLSPIKNWKSLGSLEIAIDKSQFNGMVQTNLGGQGIEIDPNITSWNFSEVPVDMLEISYKPEVSDKSKMLISIGPEGFGLIGLFILAVINCIFIVRYRKKKPQNKFNWHVWFGALGIPFFSFMIYMLAFDVIDNSIGAEAGKYHGYTFMIFVYYPFVSLGYGLIGWLIDFMLKRKLNSSV